VIVQALAARLSFNVPEAVGMLGIVILSLPGAIENGIQGNVIDSLSESLHDVFVTENLVVGLDTGFMLTVGEGFVFMLKGMQGTARCRRIEYSPAQALSRLMFLRFTLPLKMIRDMSLNKGLEILILMARDTH
jgi:hypothetical protein